jgi:hypothetical protein
VYRVDDPKLRAMVADLKAAGIEFTDQHDLRLHHLEGELDRLSDHVEALEGRLLEKIDGKARPNWPGLEPEELG